MQIHLHQTHQTIGDFQEIFSYLTHSLESQNKKNEGLHLFPELFLSGYPLQDLCLQKIFIEKYLHLIEKINKWSLELSPSESKLALIGGLDYKFDQNGLPLNIYNVAYQWRPGEKLTPVYTKRLLPNYDIFDEEKYYTPGKESYYFEFQKKQIGILICEDMWSSSMHEADPVEELFEKVQKDDVHLDLVINLSASPYHVGKDSRRKARAQEIAKAFNSPFCYVNKVGTEDEIIFDGDSFILNDREVIKQAQSFKPEVLSVDLPLKNPKEKTFPLKQKKENTWEALFNPQLENQKKGPPKISELTDELSQEVLASISFGIQEYAKKSGFKSFLVALSGGIDSALVCAIVKMSLQKEQKMEAVFMPGLFTSTESYDLSSRLCQNLGIPLRTMPIKFFHSSIRNAYKDSFRSDLEGLADENIQSRLRGSLLYARSNETNAMVLNTSNKSELAVGYSTLYGDSVGALSPLGDIYKSEVFRLSRYINQKMGNDIIPEKIITRPPTAELREDQKDEDSLPPYERLDAVLEALLSYRLSFGEIIDLGFDEKEVSFIYKLYERSEYKRVQFAPILKVKPKSFGFGHRVPICKTSLSDKKK